MRLAKLGLKINDYYFFGLNQNVKAMNEFIN